jgi:HD-GYP domain-containing protein (c-di-GMP phosphodiesterase class II)
MLDITAILASSELFSGLSPASLLRVRDQLRSVRFPRGFDICREGESGRSMYVIVSGSVSVLSDMGWGQRELDRKGPGGVFGEMALISNDVRSATVRAMGEVECLELDSDAFDSLLDQDPALAQNIAKIMTRRFSSLVHRTSGELLGAYRALTFALANLTESRDPETGAHLERTRTYCALLAELLAHHEHYRDVATPQFIDGIYQAAPLHDIGKVAVPDSILFKPAGLEADEYERMKVHTTVGGAMMDRVIRQSGADIFRVAQKICLYHHERWDGRGYPEGLAGESIPVEARIMALADVYDALLSKRVYKDAMGMREAVERLRAGAGTQFDPTMTEIMVGKIGVFEAAFLRYQDEEPVA